MINLKKVVYLGKVQERHFSVIYGMLVLLTITVLAIWRIRKTKTIFTPNAFLHNVAGYTTDVAIAPLSGGRSYHTGTINYATA